MTDVADARLFVAGVLTAIATLLRIGHTAYYADGNRILEELSLVPRPTGRRANIYKSWDWWLAPLPFVWVWLDIVIGVLVAAWLQHPLGWAGLSIWVGGRMRALQEIGHNAVHRALCDEQGFEPKRGIARYPFQWWLSDVFYQFFVFKGDMASRDVIHRQRHHRNPNHPERDPNRARVSEGGMVAPLTVPQFYARLLYPLSPAGLRNTVVTLWRGSRANRNQAAVFARIGSVAGAGVLLHAAGGWAGVVFGWLVPLLTTYPVFAWIALLSKHRWFVEEFATNPRDQEYIAGRPTDYTGLLGLLVRLFISPMSDAYHLAHSLYPTVRWNYLPVIDRYLKVNEPRYTAHASRGLLFPSDDIPSALSELRDRLTKGAP